MRKIKEETLMMKNNEFLVFFFQFPLFFSQILKNSYQASSLAPQVLLVGLILGEIRVFICLKKWANDWAKNRKISTPIRRSLSRRRCLPHDELANYLIEYLCIVVTNPRPCIFSIFTFVNNLFFMTSTFVTTCHKLLQCGRSSTS